MNEALHEKLDQRMAQLATTSLSAPLGTWKESMAAASDDEIRAMLAAAREKISDLVMRVGYLEGLQQGRAWNQPEREE